MSRGGGDGGSRRSVGRARALRCRPLREIGSSCASFHVCYPSVATGTGRGLGWAAGRQRNVQHQHHARSTMISQRLPQGCRGRKGARGRRAIAVPVTQLWECTNVSCIPYLTVVRGHAITAGKIDDEGAFANIFVTWSISSSSVVVKNHSADLKTPPSGHEHFPTCRTQNQGQVLVSFHFTFPSFPIHTSRQNSTTTSSLSQKQISQSTKQCPQNANKTCNNQWKQQAWDMMPLLLSI